MEIRLATESDRERWTGYLEGLPHQPALNSYSWKRVLEESYKTATRFFIATDKSGSICGVLPTYITKDLNGKKRLYSFRFGCVGDNNDVRDKLLSHIRFFCKDNGIASNLVTSGYQRVNTDFQEIVKKTVVMDLAADEAATWKALRDKTRNMIRKAVKSGLVAERGSRNLRGFYDIHTANMLDKGVPVHSYAFFENIFKEMNNNVELIAARKEDKIIGGVLILFSKDIALYPYQVSMKDFRNFAPNDFLTWEAIRLCLQRGIYKLDMGESEEGGGSYFFKVNFGGRPCDIYYYTTFSSKKNSGGKGRPKELSNRSLRSTVLSKGPFWLRKRVGLWMKGRGRII